MSKITSELPCEHIAETVAVEGGGQMQVCKRCGAHMLIDPFPPDHGLTQCVECKLYFEPPIDFPDLVRCWDCDPEMDRFIHEKDRKSHSPSLDK